MASSSPSAVLWVRRMSIAPASTRPVAPGTLARYAARPVEVNLLGPLEVEAAPSDVTVPGLVPPPGGSPGRCTRARPSGVSTLKDPRSGEQRARPPAGPVHEAARASDEHQVDDRPAAVGP